MLPPISSNVLASNPEFAKLHEHLTKHKLIQDNLQSASGVHSDQNMHTELQQARIRHARQQLLLDFLQGLADTPEQNGKHVDNKTQNPGLSSVLSNDVQACVSVVTDFLRVAQSPRTTHLPADAEELLNGDFQMFQDHLPEIAHILTKQIIETEQTLSGFAAEALPQPSKPQSTRGIQATRPSTRAVPQQRLTQTLHSAEHSHQEILASTLPDLLRDTTTALGALLSEHRTQLVSTIRRLEQTTHGTEARHTLAKAGLLGVVAEGIECKARMLRLQESRDQLSDEENVARLRATRTELAREEARLDQRERELAQLLRLYEEEGGEDIFRQLGARYGEVEREMEVVKGDVEKLEQNSKD